MGVVNEAVGGVATVINAAGSMPGDLLKLWRSADPKAYHVEYGYSCMGYEIPAGLGVKLAEPGREVVVFVGDGTYLMMNSEIVTAVAEGLAFTIVLVDNHGYQSIHGLQRSVGSPSFINELRHRDPVSGRTMARPWPWTSPCTPRRWARWRWRRTTSMACARRSRWPARAIAWR